MSAASTTSIYGVNGGMLWSTGPFPCVSPSCPYFSCAQHAEPGPVVSMTHAPRQRTEIANPRERDRETLCKRGKSKRRKSGPGTLVRCVSSRSAVLFHARCVRSGFTGFFFLCLCASCFRISRLACCAPLLWLWLPFPSCAGRCSRSVLCIMLRARVFRVVLHPPSHVRTPWIPCFGYFALFVLHRWVLPFQCVASLASWRG